MRFAILALLALSAFGADPAPLATAIKSGQRAAALDMLAKKSGDVNAVETDGSTALLWAANLNDTDLVSRLIKAGANAKAKNQLGSTPLSEAVYNSNTEMVKVLLDAGADPNATGPDGQTPLMVVAKTSNVAIAKLLLAEAKKGRK